VTDEAPGTYLRLRHQLADAQAKVDGLRTAGDRLHRAAHAFAGPGMPSGNWSTMHRDLADAIEAWERAR